MKSATPYRPFMIFPQTCSWPLDWLITVESDCHSRRQLHLVLWQLSRRYLPEERDSNARVLSEAINFQPQPPAKTWCTW
jgi:hypothetical protein